MTYGWRQGRPVETLGRNSWAPGVWGSNEPVQRGPSWWERASAWLASL